MFVQISPSEKDLSETLSSLNFATRVRGIELGPARKQIDTSELQKMKLMVCLVLKQWSSLYYSLSPTVSLCPDLFLSHCIFLSIVLLFTSLQLEKYHPMDFLQ